MGNWSGLCDEILDLIVDQFSAVEDIVNFGAVCRQWRSVSVKRWPLSTEYLWLMLAEKESSDNRGFYSFSTKKVYYLNLPEACGRKCWSSCGWLITFGLDLEIQLLNPFSRPRVLIRLPPQPTLPYQYSTDTGPKSVRRFFIRKVILSSRPSSEDDDEKCVVMAIYSEDRKLAFLRLGDEVWTPVDTHEGIANFVDGHVRITDVIYFNGQFYAITKRGELLIVDISSSHPKTIEFAEPPEGVDDFVDFYLVESVGELFMLAWVVYVGGEWTSPSWFDVYKFNFDNRMWTKVKSLDNRALFVGDNASFTIFPSNHLGCEPNCMYFADDDLFGGCEKVRAGRDMGVYQTETKKVDYRSPDILSSICAPIWINPSP
ncbi:putative F-box protein At5g55150 [Macadamia integrifolia]|uniref:putative F-box protein At5g55150 n=1 Tax=Macadamia integrifolia TaxID=60698 RepID=UPI001C4EA49F|nr:putative F-box protein At5g55150 [Macadamia integrifolia]XP_042503455.1 putative F-box protein At5g55150 [Macadamia integrifolia]